MKRKLSNRALLDKRRFQVLEEEKTLYLQELTIEESVRIFESLTSVETMGEFSPFFSQNTPMNLKAGLRHATYE